MLSIPSALQTMVAKVSMFTDFTLVLVSGYIIFQDQTRHVHRDAMRCDSNGNSVNQRVISFIFIIGVRTPMTSLIGHGEKHGRCKKSRLIRGAAQNRLCERQITTPSSAHIVVAATSLIVHRF